MSNTADGHGYKEPILGEDVVLKEKEEQTDLLRELPLKAQLGFSSLKDKFTNRGEKGLKQQIIAAAKNSEPLKVEYTCIDVTSPTIVIGSNLGIVFLYDRSRRKLSKFTCDQKQIPISCIKLLEAKPFVATGQYNGAVTLFHYCEEKNGIMRVNLKCTVQSHHRGPVTAIQWTPDGTKLFTADSEGNVAITVINMDEGKTHTVFICKEDSPVVQLSFSHTALLISTLKRTLIWPFNTKKTVQVGMQERKVFGNFGACFYPAAGPIATDDVVDIYAARPGLRLWKATIDGKVLTTMMFKDSINKGLPPIETLELASNLGLPPQQGEYKQFGPLVTFHDQFVATWQGSCVWVMDPSTGVVVGCHSNLGCVVDVGVNKNELFVLTKGQERFVRRITFEVNPCIVVEELDLNNPNDVLKAQRASSVSQFEDQDKLDKLIGEFGNKMNDALINVKSRVKGFKEQIRSREQSEDDRGSESDRFSSPKGTYNKRDMGGSPDGALTSEGYSTGEEKSEDCSKYTLSTDDYNYSDRPFESSNELVNSCERSPIKPPGKSEQTLSSHKISEDEKENNPLYENDTKTVEVTITHKKRENEPVFSHLSKEEFPQDIVFEGTSIGTGKKKKKKKTKKDQRSVVTLTDGPVVSTNGACHENNVTLQGMDILPTTITPTTNQDETSPPPPLEVSTSGISESTQVSVVSTSGTTIEHGNEACLAATSNENLIVTKLAPTETSSSNTLAIEDEKSNYDCFANNQKLETELPVGSFNNNECKIPDLIPDEISNNAQFPPTNNTTGTEADTQNDFFTSDGSSEGTASAQENQRSPVVVSSAHIDRTKGEEPNDSRTNQLIISNSNSTSNLIEPYKDSELSADGSKEELPSLVNKTNHCSIVTDNISIGSPQHDVNGHLPCANNNSTENSDGSITPVTATDSPKTPPKRPPLPVNLQKSPKRDRCSPLPSPQRHLQQKVEHHSPEDSKGSVECSDQISELKNPSTPLQVVTSVESITNYPPSKESPISTKNTSNQKTDNVVHVKFHKSHQRQGSNVSIASLSERCKEVKGEAIEHNLNVISPTNDSDHELLGCNDSIEANLQPKQTGPSVVSGQSPEDSDEDGILYPANPFPTPPFQSIYDEKRVSLSDYSLSHDESPIDFDDDELPGDEELLDAMMEYDRIDVQNDLIESMDSITDIEDNDGTSEADKSNQDSSGVTVTRKKRRTKTRNSFPSSPSGSDLEGRPSNKGGVAAESIQERLRYLADSWAEVNLKNLGQVQVIATSEYLVWVIDNTDQISFSPAVTSQTYTWKKLENSMKALSIASNQNGSVVWCVDRNNTACYRIGIKDGCPQDKDILGIVQKPGTFANLHCPGKCCAACNHISPTCKKCKKSPSSCQEHVCPGCDKERLEYNEYKTICCCCGICIACNKLEYHNDVKALIASSPPLPLTCQWYKFIRSLQIALYFRNLFAHATLKMCDDFVKRTGQLTDNFQVCCNPDELKIYVQFVFKSIIEYTTTKYSSFISAVKEAEVKKTLNNLDDVFQYGELLQNYLKRRSSKIKEIFMEDMTFYKRLEELVSKFEDKVEKIVTKVVEENSFKEFLLKIPITKNQFPWFHKWCPRGAISGSEIDQELKQIFQNSMTEVFNESFGFQHGVHYKLPALTFPVGGINRNRNSSSFDFEIKVIGNQGNPFPLQAQEHVDNFKEKIKEAILNKHNLNIDIEIQSLSMGSIIFKGTVLHLDGEFTTEQQTDICTTIKDNAKCFFNLDQVLIGNDQPILLVQFTIEVASKVFSKIKENERNVKKLFLEKINTHRSKEDYDKSYNGLVKIDLVRKLKKGFVLKLPLLEEEDVLVEYKYVQPDESWRVAKPDKKRDGDFVYLRVENLPYIGDYEIRVTVIYNEVCKNKGFLKMTVENIKWKIDRITVVSPPNRADGDLFSFLDLPNNKFVDDSTKLIISLFNNDESNNDIERCESDDSDSDGDDFEEDMLSEVVEAKVFHIKGLRYLERNFPNFDDVIFFPPLHTIEVGLKRISEMFIELLNKDIGLKIVLSNYDDSKYFQFIQDPDFKNTFAAPEYKGCLTQNRLLIFYSRFSAILNLRIVEGKKDIHQEMANCLTDLKRFSLTFKSFITQNIILTGILVCPEMSRDEVEKEMEFYFNSDKKSKKLMKYFFLTKDEIQSMLVENDQNKSIPQQKDLELWWEAIVAKKLRKVCSKFSSMRSEESIVLFKKLSGQCMATIACRVVKSKAERLPTISEDEQEQILTLLLNNAQMEAIYGPGPKKIIWGPYGSGKSIVSESLVRLIYEKSKDKRSLTWYAIQDDYSLLEMKNHFFLMDMLSDVDKSPSTLIESGNFQSLAAVNAERKNALLKFLRAAVDRKNEKAYDSINVIIDEVPHNSIEGEAELEELKKVLKEIDNFAIFLRSGNTQIQSPGQGETTESQLFQLGLQKYPLEKVMRNTMDIVRLADSTQDTVQESKSVFQYTIVTPIASNSSIKDCEQSSTRSNTDHSSFTVNATQQINSETVLQSNEEETHMNVGSSMETSGQEDVMELETPDQENLKELEASDTKMNRNNKTFTISPLKAIKHIDNQGYSSSNSKKLLVSTSFPRCLPGNRVTKEKPNLIKLPKVFDINSDEGGKILSVIFDQLCLNDFKDSKDSTVIICNNIKEVEISYYALESSKSLQGCSILHVPELRRRHYTEKEKEDAYLAMKYGNKILIADNGAMRGLESRHVITFVNPMEKFDEHILPEVITRANISLDIISFPVGEGPGTLKNVLNNWIDKNAERKALLVNETVVQISDSKNVAMLSSKEVDKSSKTTNLIINVHTKDFKDYCKQLDKTLEKFKEDNEQELSVSREVDIERQFHDRVDKQNTGQRTRTEKSLEKINFKIIQKADDLHAIITKASLKIQNILALLLSIYADKHVSSSPGTNALNALLSTYISSVRMAAKGYAVNKIFTSNERRNIRPLLDAKTLDVPVLLNILLNVKEVMGIDRRIGICTTCVGKCCTSCNHTSPTCKQCKKLTSKSSQRCKHKCTKCPKTRTECETFMTICCHLCGVCMGCNKSNFDNVMLDVINYSPINQKQPCPWYSFIRTLEILRDFSSLQAHGTMDTYKNLLEQKAVLLRFEMCNTPSKLLHYLEFVIHHYIVMYIRDNFQFDFPSKVQEVLRIMNELMSIFRQ